MVYAPHFGWGVVISWLFFDCAKRDVLWDFWFILAWQGMEDKKRGSEWQNKDVKEKNKSGTSRLKGMHGCPLKKPIVPSCPISLQLLIQNYGVSLIYFYSQWIIPSPFLRWRKHSRPNICGHRASGTFYVCLLRSKLPGDSWQTFISKQAVRQNWYDCAI